MGKIDLEKRAEHSFEWIWNSKEIVRRIIDRKCDIKKNVKSDIVRFVCQTYALSKPFREKPMLELYSMIESILINRDNINIILCETLLFTMCINR